MVVRLAFSVSVFLEPDLLIIDEALSVGDVFFQQKCFAHLQKLRDAGVSFLFVSHDMAAMRKLCDRCILLERGRKVYDGPPEEAITRFFSMPSGALTRDASEVKAFEPDIASDPESISQTHNILTNARSRHGQGGLQIMAATICNEEGTQAQSVPVDGKTIIRLVLFAKAAVRAPSAGIHVFDRMNNLVFAAGSRQLGMVIPDLLPGDKVWITFELTWSVQPGEYTFSLGCSEPSLDGPNTGLNHDRHEGLGPVSVFYPSGHVMPFYGLARLPFLGKVASLVRA
jgi:hypothetical protein